MLIEYIQKAEVRAVEQKSSMFARRMTHDAKGFTLIELAMVLVVIGLLIGLGMSLIGPLTKRAKLIETRETVKQAKEAVLGYAVKNGYLPATLEDAGARKLDAWGRELLFYRATEIDESTENACGVNTTAMTVRECTNADCTSYLTKSNIAFVVYSKGEDNDSACTGTASPFSIWEQGSGYNSPCVYTTTNPAFNYDDVVAYVSLDEIRSLRGCPQPLVITSPVSPATLTEGEEDSFYSYSLQAMGGMPPYTWTGSAGSGLALNSAGLISGMLNFRDVAPNTGELANCSEVLNVTAAVSDSAGSRDPATGTKSFAIPVRPKPLTIINTDMPSTTVGAVNSNFADLEGTGGRSANYSWSLSGNPAWLSVNPSTGVLSVNNPTTAGTYSFTANLSDGCPGGSTSKRFTITVNPAAAAGSPTCTLTANPSSMQTPGTSVLTWSINNGPANGTWSPAPGGTCTNFSGSSGGSCTTGTINTTTAFTLTVTNAQGSSQCAATVYVGVPPGPVPLCTLEATPNPVPIGNPTSLIWTIFNGPASVSCTSSPTTGLCSSGSCNPSSSYGGNCTTSAINTNTTFQLAVTNANGTGFCATTAYVSWTAVCPVLSITTTSLPNGRMNLAYPATTLQGSGGITPYTWSWIKYPAGLSLDSSTGQITGTPTKPGVYNTTVTLTDNCPQSTNRAYAIAIGRYDTYNVRNFTGGNIWVRGGQYGSCTRRNNNQTFGVRRVDTSSVNIYTDSICTTPATLSSVSYATVIPVDEAGDRDGNVRINAAWTLVDE